MCWSTFVMLQLLSVVTVTHGRETAFLEIILYELNQDNGRYTTHKTDITGKFSSAGSSNAAEGEIVQMHPFSLCDDASNYEEKYEYGWVGVIKLVYAGSDPCQSLVGKAKRAVDKGATAVIFDISDHPGAVQQLSLETRYMVNRPIVLVQGQEAVELMKIIENKQVARARIQRSLPVEDAPSSRFFHNGIIIACLVFVFILGSVITAKIKCLKKRRQMTFHDLALQALEQMKTKRYIGRKKPHASNSKKTSEAEKWSLSSGGSICAICLEEFSDGQELRVIPCHHEFHKRCVDPWLKQKWTCPLCNRNILRDFSTLMQRVPSPELTSHHDDERMPLAIPADDQRDTHSSIELVSEHSHRYAESIDKYEESRHHFCSSQNPNYASTSNRTNCPSQFCGRNCNTTGTYQEGEGHLVYSPYCLASRHRTASDTSDVTLPTGNSTCGSKLERDLSTDCNEMFQTSYARTKRESEWHTGTSHQSEEFDNKKTLNEMFYCGHVKRKPLLLGNTNGLASSLPCQKCNGRHTVLQSANLNLGTSDCNLIQSFSLYKAGKSLTSVEHPSAVKVVRSPSLRSGYVPDSPDSSDCNLDSHREGVPCLHESYPCLNANLFHVCQSCQLRLNSLHNASTQCMHGSLSLTKNPSLFSLYSAKSTEPNQPSPVDIMQGLIPRGSSELLDEKKLYGIQARSFTPCVEYSSSDGVEDLARHSNSSLEGILEALESGSVASHS